MDEKALLIQEQLTSSDGEVRIAATRQLARLTAPSVDLFISSLGDPDWRVRKAAIETFQELSHSAENIQDLIRLLYHPENAGLRNAAIEILIGFGSLAVEQLRSEIFKPDVEVRKFVIDILGEICDPGCAPDLIVCLHDADINVRYAAAETLGKLKAEAAVEPLMALMADPDPGLKFTILQSLSQIGGSIPTDRLFVYLDDRLLRKTLFDCFARVGGSEVVPPLIEGLCDPMRQVREAALSALDMLRVREIHTIKRVLVDADLEQISADLELIFSGEKLQLKTAALALYGDVGAERDLSLLLNCFSEEGLRSHTLNTFSALGEEPFARLVDLFDSVDQLQTLYLIFAGGELGFVSVLPIAVMASQSNDPQLRNTAARAIGALGGGEHLDLLLRLLDDEITDIQNAAAAAVATLARRNKTCVLPRISSMFNDPDAEKRMRVVRILGLIDGEGIEALLLKAFKDSSATVRCEAIRALNGHFSEVVISGLTLALTDESGEVRRLAVSALGQCPQEQALPALTLAAADADFWVRAAVMRVLAVFPGENVRNLLLNALIDPVGLVVIAALESSVSVLPDECRSLLEEALIHPDEEVVKVAMDQLSRILDWDWIAPFCADLLNHAHWDVRLHAANFLGRSEINGKSRLLEERLAVEGEAPVRQAIESAISGRLRTDSQGC